MQIIVTIPDELAAQVAAGGVTPETYVETLIAQHLQPAPSPLDTEARLADLEVFLKEMATHSSNIPALPDEAFTRESFYRDYD